MGLCFKKPLSPFIKKWINPSPSIVHFHPCLACYYSIVLYIFIPVGSVIIQFYIHMCNMYIHLCVACYHSIVNIHPCLACYHLILNIHPCLAWYYFYLVLHIRPCLKCYHPIVLYTYPSLCDGTDAASYQCSDDIWQSTLSHRTLHVKRIILDY